MSAATSLPRSPRRRAAPDPAPPATKVADAQGGGAPRRATSNAQITKIEAKGDVVITSDKDQTTTSDWAIYDLPSQLVTVGGNVVLTQGENVLKGDRLVIDLKTGESRFENTGNSAAGGRIRALFMPKGRCQESQDRAKPTPKPGDASRRRQAEAATRQMPQPRAARRLRTAHLPTDVPWPISPDAQP